MQLSGRHVWITGCNRGMGFEFFKEIYNQGAIVHACIRSIHFKEAKQFEDQDRIIIHHLDLSTSESIKQFLLDIAEKQWPIDVFIHNAGVLTGKPLDDLNLEEIAIAFQVNLVGVAQLTSGIIPMMKKQKESKIVFNGSVSSFMSFPMANVYTASKAGLWALYRSLAVELKKENISALFLATPAVSTDMFRSTVKLFGKVFNLNESSAMEASEYAKLVVKAINEDLEVLWPEGQTKYMIWLDRHFPGVFKRALERQYSNRSSR